jgi:hypothetical protein
LHNRGKRESPIRVPKRNQLSIGTYDETLSVAVRVSDPDSFADVSGAHDAAHDFGGR